MGVATGAGSTVETLEGSQPGLWGVTLLFFCVGDLVTTHVGLTAYQVVEVGPVVAPVVRQYGLVAMVALKVLTVGASYGAWRAAPEPHRVGVPLGLAVLGVLVVAWNLTILGLSVL